MALKEYAGAAKETRLNSSLAAGTTTGFTVATNGGSGYPTGNTAPFVVVIDPDTEIEEKILVSTRANDVFSTLDRGYDGTTDTTHSAQAIVRHVWDAASATEASQHVNDDARDDHSQYLNGARHALVAHTATMIQDLSITTGDLADGLVTGPKIEEAQRWLPGDLKFTARSTAPDGWLICNGAAVSRATYADLFTAIGSAFGDGNGTTTFNLPDLRRKFPLGKADSGTGSTLGASGGSNNAIAVSHNHTQDGHNHTQNGHGHTQDAHSHSITDPQHHHSIGGGDFGFNIAFRSGPVQNERIANAGSGVYITYTNIDNAATGITGTNGGTATNQGTTASNQAATATNQASGSSATDANMPEYQVVNYMIKI
jgi:microcystin-dependent protein